MNQPNHAIPVGRFAFLHADTTMDLVREILDRTK
jgi:hypothetical protein